MKNIAIGLLNILLCAAPSAHAQQIADVPAKNPSEMLLSEIEGTFIPDRTADVPKDFSSWTWGTGLDISNNWWGADPPPPGWNNNYSAGVNFTSSSTFLSTAPIPPSFSCGSLNDVAGRKGMSTQNVPTNDSTCNHTLGMAYSLVTDGFYDQAYDSTCYYLSHCYAQAVPQEAFGALSESEADTVQNQTGRTSLRNFLLSILPLRNDDAWFCDCVLHIGGSFFEDTNSDREQLSLLYWLINNPRCAAYQSTYVAAYNQEREDDYSLWLDTTHWPDTVYDSTLLTMQQMGLDTVLIISATEGVSPQAIGSQILLSASITENPFENSTSIALSVGREAYITIAVYNVLGQQIAGAGYSGVFEQGSATVPINMSNAPPGTYLVRISTANNEVQTLKLTKE